MTAVLAHKAADYEIGDPDGKLSEVATEICRTCGGVLVPLLGKIREGTMLDWTVWIKGNYEHVERYEGSVHPAVPR